jgi:hypothetical protein
MFSLVEHKIKKTTEQVLKESLKKDLNPRKIGIEMAKEKIISKQKVAKLSKKKL